MCGIATLIRLADVAMGSDVIGAMNDIVRHRGPDGSGTAFLQLNTQGVRECQPSAGEAWRVALGHRRLSILDLSPAGRQPMCYGDQYWITFNGEIYNYLELRDELRQLGHEFQSNSDTEVILAAYAQWGAECFARLRGMWGLVLIDGPRQQAILSRDRLGIKPLYIGVDQGLLVVASEIKQFSVTIVALQPEQTVLADYLATGYEDDAKTFFRNIHPLPPATWQAIDLQTGQVAPPKPYWFPERVGVSIHDPQEAADRLRALLAESVRIHLRSDVPVGCALSGGLDSSSIAACVSELANGSGQRFDTFSVVFPGSAIDEQSFAQEVVNRIHAAPHYLSLEPEEFLNDLDRFTWIHDEPVGSVSQYAAYALARITREAGVPVTLNGQGGDEVLGGYWQSYFMHLRSLARSGSLFRLGQHFGGSLFAGGNPELARQVPFMVRRYRARMGAGKSSSLLRQPAGTSVAENRLTQIMGMDEQQRRVYDIRQMFLPRLLKWDDRNFMAFSVEGRYPFLDHQLIELCLSFAPRVLYDRGWTKEPLRRGLKGLLPASILRRKTKFGFETPQNAWLCGGLKPTIAAWLKSDAPLWQFVEPLKAQQLADEVWTQDGRHEESAQALMRLFLADRWMRIFFA